MKAFVLFSLALLAATVRAGFDPTSKKNFVIYWGQANGLGEKDLSEYCKNDDYNIIVVSFIYEFPKSSAGLPYPTFAVSGHCWEKYPDGSGVLHCPSLANEIKYCQSQNKTVIVSLGGGIGKYGFNSKEEAEGFAQTVWDMFLGGKSDHRPFDDVILDGVDLDIELGPQLYYTEFVNKLESIWRTSGRRYIMSAAPQCPFSDKYMGPDGTTWNGKPINGSVLSNTHVDFVSVQFYNNPQCNAGTAGFREGSWSYGVWDKWAGTAGKKIIVGMLASKTTLDSAVSDIDFAARYPNFAGAMMWDAHTADAGCGHDLSTWMKENL